MRYFFTYLSETERISTHLNAENLQYKFYNDFLYKLKEGTVHNFRNTHKEIKFTGPIFRHIWNGFDVFNAVSSGEISFSIIGKSLFVSYKFYFWEYFVIALLFSIPAFFSMMPNIAFRIIYLLVVWIIYMIATSLSSFRFKRYLFKTVKKYEEEYVVDDFKADFKSA